ncbi:MAG: hypothetical protein GQ540_02545 [Lutibacter sp.]|uniref:DUF5916 domain-containing protein n=1 Tax=Lutibacter sp. TaxID=1925666 RepID=UPI0019E42E1B|nr:DUF5916 domain-containing protein [Lutibacter sp.]NOR27387.1 hypothetical protein [Lutibacter sp.]
MKTYFIIFCLLIVSYSYSQSSVKSINAVRVSNSPTIDGVLDDEAWINAEIAKDFTMFRPGSGDKEPENKKTEVKVIYDDEAIYFGAFLYDDDVNSIPKESATRDNFAQTDWFGVIINTLNDGQNDTEFFVQVTGNQADAKVSINNEDFSWNAVWTSAAKINSKGWVAEIKIPYSALRFSNGNVQTWGLNFHRRIQNKKEQYTWNFIDKTNGSLGQYSGILEGLKNIQPPTRLSFYPYASSSYVTFDGNNEFNTNYGVDVKYGINESFTLDATLIPDFGQTAFDDVTLNLGPFEQHFSEKRSFFTEGTELFSKGDLFYSRRIGNAPTAYYDEENLGENEEIIDNPTSVNMLNAIKISGRTKKGLGIGVFNAITEKTEATIKKNEIDPVSFEEIISFRKVVTEPFANYSVVVLDQQFNKNSSVSFVNTNVLRNGSFRDANVSGLLFNLSNKTNKYNVNGGVGMSTINEFGEKSTGYISSIEIGKVSGHWQYEIEHNLQDTKFDKNDLGFQRRNNFSNFEGKISYRIFEPTEKFDDYRITFWGGLNYLYKPNTYTGNYMGLNYFFQTKKTKTAFGGNVQSNIGNQFDYYEPRVEGRYFKQGGRLSSNQWFSTDYRKKFAIDANIFYAKRLNDDNHFIFTEIAPRYRVNDNLSFIYSLRYTKDTNDKGYVNELENGAIIFGNRDAKSVTNSISGKYNFSTKAALSLTFRQYWSPVKYDDQYYVLNNDGTLSEDSYTANHDINFNTWNFDLNFTWEFAPGSQLIALYRNSLFNEDEFSDLNFKDNLSNLFKEPMLHNFSVRMVYYIDYNNAKKWFRKS